MCWLGFTGGGGIPTPAGAGRRFRAWHMAGTWMDSHHDAVVTVLDAEIHTQNISKGRYVHWSYTYKKYGI